MEKGSHSISAFLQEDKKMFQENSLEIMQRNNDVLKSIAPFYLYVLVAFSLFMHFSPYQNKGLDLIYLIFIAIQTLYLIILKRRIQAAKRGSNPIKTRDGRLFQTFFSICVISFIITVSIFPYTAKPSIYFAPLLIILAVIFIQPVIKNILFSSVAWLVFNIAVTCFKTEEAISFDRYSSITGLLGAFITGIILCSVRQRDFRSRKELEKFVSIDELTGVLNKGTCERLCQAYLEDTKGSSSSTLLMIDIDNFKAINDGLGHQQGDRVLVQFGKLLQENFRRDDILGRIGGDEFLILMKNMQDPAIIKAKASTLMGNTSKIFSEYMEKQVSCSIGIAMNIGNEKSFKTMLYRADTALYASKERGKNLYYFYSEIITNSDAEKPLMLIADDSEVGRAILSNIFHTDYSIVLADSGKQAIELMQRYYRLLTVVLLDWIMPGLGGEEVLKIIRQDENLNSLPILVITGDETMELSALQNGAKDYITKPFNSDIIKLRVKNAMRHVT